MDLWEVLWGVLDICFLRKNGLYSIRLDLGLDIQYSRIVNVNVLIELIDNYYNIIFLSRQRFYIHIKYLKYLYLLFN
jgi:hypothetical protein